MKACTKSKGMAGVQLHGKEVAGEASHCFPTHFAVFTEFDPWLCDSTYQTRPWTEAAKALWGRRGAADVLVDVLEELTPPSPRCCWLVLKNAPLRMPQNGHWMTTAHIFPKGERWAPLLHNSVPVDLHFELFWIFSCIYSDVKEKLNFFSKSCSDNLKWHLTDSAIYCAIHAQKTRNAEYPFPQILHS